MVPVLGVNRSVAILSEREAVTFHSAAGCGSWPRVAVIAAVHLVAVFSVPAATTGRVRTSLASPGMQTSLHMSHSAVACSVTSVPGLSVAGGVSSTSRKTSPV